MIFKQLRRAIIIAAVLGVLAIFAIPALGAPQLQGDGLLTNPGFENGTYPQDGDAQIQSPNYWTTWWIVQEGGTTSTNCLNWAKPNVGLKGGDGEMRSGSFSGAYHTQWSSHHAGFYQSVTGVEAGTIYRFSIWGKAFSRPEGSTDSANTKMWVGIDPTGGTDATSANVVWSGVNISQDAWIQPAVEAAAQGSTITVFTRSQPDWCSDINQIYWDDASLTAVGEAATPTEEADEGPAPTASTYETATPDETGRLVHTVQQGDTLSGIAWQYGVTVDQIKQLNNLESNVVVLGTRLVIRSGETTETPEPTEEPTEEPADDGGEGSEGDDGGDGEGDVSGSEETADIGSGDSPGDDETASNASVCITSYEDSNGNGIREPNEQKVSNITFILNDGSETVGTHTTTTASGFYCWEGLTAGTYFVSWTGDGYQPTTEQDWAVDVSAGAILQREFGMQTAGSNSSAGGGQNAADTSLGGEGGGLPTWAIALIGAVAVIVFLAGVGAVGYFFFIRRQQKI